jgi:predicted HTH transcriptional regulator
MTMKNSETKAVDPLRVRELKKLVAEGEGPHLEFKRKAAMPEKIVRELIAFANTAGGTLLIGVDDNKTLAGTKYPDEDLHVVNEALKKYCRPPLTYQETVIHISEKKSIVRMDIAPGSRLHYLVVNKDTRHCYIRQADMSIKASSEMVEIARRKKQKRDIRFTFGEAEKQLMEYLEAYPAITLAGFQKLAGLNRFRARRKLILLVLANVLKITATEKGDLYSRV